jgi:hypothetical protein
MQFQVGDTMDKICKAYFLTAWAAAVSSRLGLLLKAFPIMIQGFHSDHSSEYINGWITALLRKLVIDFTKFRARQING